MSAIKPLYGYIVIGKISNAPLSRIQKPYGTLGVYSKRKFAKQSICWSPEQAKVWKKYYRTAKIKISEVV